MRIFRQMLVAFALLLALAAPQFAVAAERGEPLQSYIVVLEESEVSASSTRSVAESTGGEVVYEYDSAFQGATVLMTAEQAEALKNSGQVRSVVEEVPVRAMVQTTPTGIQRIDTPGIDGSGPNLSDVHIAVLDTGIDLDHPDLNVGVGIDCVDLGTSPDDDHGHGTHVAGTVAAIDNTAGVVGAAPGAVVHPVKVLNSAGSSVTGSLGCGLDWVLDNAATIDVVNMSLGGTTTAPDEDNCGLDNGDGFHQFVCAIVDAGITVVVAAGNEDEPTTYKVPARYQEAITVSALADSDGLAGGLGSATWAGPDDSMASFSNYGNHVDVIAPGVSILSTVPNNSYAFGSGTSMAAPHVAGAAAAYIAQNPGATPAQIDLALKSTGNFNWTGDKDSTKEPLINAGALLASDPPPPPSADPMYVSAVNLPSQTVSGGRGGVTSYNLTGQVTILADGTAVGGASVTVSLTGPGTNVSLSATTNTSGVAAFNRSVSQAGDYTITATNVTKSGMTYDSSLNTVSSATVNTDGTDSGGDDPTPPPPDDPMYLNAVSLSSATVTARNGSTSYNLTGKVTILAGSTAVGGASVSVSLTGPGTSVSLSATTNTSGVAAFSRSVSQSGDYTITVTNVTKSGMTYDSSLNVVSSATVTAS
ncbi:hypothetical protein BH23CHL2_BH23CHL2_25110 [soil metagenome]